MVGIVLGDLLGENMGLHGGLGVCWVPCAPWGWGSEPFTQEAHRYRDIRCGTLKSSFWKN